METIIVAAREHHQRASSMLGMYRHHLQKRDELIRELRASNPREWTYAKISETIGCSPELVAKIIKA